MIDQRVRSEWVRGLLPLLVLAALSESDAHGYLIAKRLSGSGLGVIKGGVLYPVLNRMEREGSISAQWLAGDGGPGRKSFSLTDAGRGRLTDLSPQWAQFAVAIEDVLGSPTERSANRKGSA